MSEQPPKSNKTQEEIQRETDEAWGENSVSKPNVTVDVEDSATTNDGSIDISATELGDNAEKPEEVLVKSEDNNTLLNMGNPKEIAKFLETAEDREQQISKLIEILENEGSEFSKNGEIISQLNVTNANIDGIENLSVEQFTGLVDRLRSRS